MMLFKALIHCVNVITSAKQDIDLLKLSYLFCAKFEVFSYVHRNKNGMNINMRIFRRFFVNYITNIHIMIYTSYTYITILLISIIRYSLFDIFIITL